MQKKELIPDLKTFSAWQAVPVALKALSTVPFQVDPPARVGEP